MLQVSHWKAFDGRLFNSEEDCREYESAHPFLDMNQIVFYSNEGRIIGDPDEHVLIDSNAFKVSNREVFTMYAQFRKELKLKEPKAANVEFPCHYCFMNNKWICIEEEILKWQNILRNSFTDEFVENEDERHDLVGRIETDEQF